MCMTICSLCLFAFPYVAIIFTWYPSQAALLTPNQLLCHNVLTWQLFWDGPSQCFSNLNNEQSPSVTEVIHQHDLGDQLRWGAVQHAVDGAEQGGPALVVEGDDDAGVGQCLQVALADAVRVPNIRERAIQGDFITDVDVESIFSVRLIHSVSVSHGVRSPLFPVSYTLSIPSDGFFVVPVLQLLPISQEKYLLWLIV